MVPGQNIETSSATRYRLRVNFRVLSGHRSGAVGALAHIGHPSRGDCVVDDAGSIRRKRALRRTLTTWFPLECAYAAMCAGIRSPLLFERMLGHSVKRLRSH
jgi:hypothetical protein